MVISVRQLLLSCKTIITQQDFFAFLITLLYVYPLEGTDSEPLFHKTEYSDHFAENLKLLVR